MKRISIVHEPPLWALWWVDIPPLHPRERPDDMYLCGFLDRSAAVEKARAEGWEIVGE